VPLQSQCDRSIRELTLKNRQVACRGSALRCIQKDGSVRKEDTGASVRHTPNAFLVTLNRHDIGGKLKLIKAICQPFLTWRAAHHRQSLLLDKLCRVTAP